MRSEEEIRARIGLYNLEVSAAVQDFLVAADGSDEQQRANKKILMYAVMAMILEWVLENEPEEAMARLPELWYRELGDLNLEL